MAKKKLAVLISGNGSNLQAILDACIDNTIHAEVVVVGSNKKDAYGLTRAQSSQVPTFCLPNTKDTNRNEYDKQLSEIILPYEPDYVILAGWMRKLSMDFLKKFKNHVINIHPALPDTFPGTHAIERAFEAFQRGQISQSGVMIHYVPDEGVDNGPLILKEKVAIYSEDTLAQFEERIHQTEHRLYIEALRMLCK
jgi:phosphoribosylglycinamide formyltransferase-1